jgi:N-methylhydantoinase B
MSTDPVTQKVVTDPVTREVVASRLREIASTMEYALYHSGYSPTLRESQDGTAGLTDGDGNTVLVSGGLQYHSLPYEQAVRSTLARYPKDRMRPGDSFVVNDPYHCGNPHVPDTVAVTPIFLDGTIVAFGVSIAHKPDLGGIVPGSSGAAAREIYHDGLLLPPVIYQTAEGINEVVEAIIRSNSRVPDVVLGDLRAQVGCTRMGGDRLVELCREYGAPTVLAAMKDMMKASARRLQAQLADWPDGTAEAEVFLDDDGAVRGVPVRIHVKATKKGDRLTLDFSGSGPQTLGPVNLNSQTCQSVSTLAVLACSDPSIPMNSGLREVVDFVIPDGLVVNPRHPATINNYYPTAVMAYTVTLTALGKINPAKAVAQCGLGTGAILIGYRKSNYGRPAVQHEIVGAALGGTSGNDGVAVVTPMNHVTCNCPLEILESDYPVMVQRYDIWTDSAGAGRYRGGIGYIREYKVLDNCVFTVRKANHRFAASGINGGQAPVLPRTIINLGRPDEEELTAIDTRNLKPGDTITIMQGGGAGYGNPAERPLESVQADVEDHYVSREQAARAYGRNL